MSTSVSRNSEQVVKTTKGVKELATTVGAGLPGERHIFRKHHNRDFTIIGNAPLNDERLSADALGLLIYVWSKPDDWVVMVNQLTKRFHCGRDKIDRCLKELIAAGYVVRHQGQAAAGRWASVEYDVYEEPQNQAGPLRENPDAVETQQNHGPAPLRDLPLPAKPLPVKPNILSTDSTKDGIYQVQEAQTAFAPSAGVENEEVKKGKSAPSPESKWPPRKELTPADRQNLDDLEEIYADKLEEHDGQYPITSVHQCGWALRELWENVHNCLPHIQTTVDPAGLHFIRQWDEQGLDVALCFAWVVDKLFERVRAGDNIQSLAYFDRAIQQGVAEMAHSR